MIHRRSGSFSLHLRFRPRSDGQLLGLRCPRRPLRSWAGTSSTRSSTRDSRWIAFRPNKTLDPFLFLLCACRLIKKRFAEHFVRYLSCLPVQYFYELKGALSAFSKKVTSVASSPGRSRHRRCAGPKPVSSDDAAHAASELRPRRASQLLPQEVQD